ncbi:hypothetical protein MJD09_23230, partial [bacterium]|nr:hypothetical protein [bacterium]
METELEDQTDGGELKLGAIEKQESVMDKNDWWNHYKNAYKLSARTFTSKDEDFLLQEYAKGDAIMQEKMLDVAHIMMKYFFHMATVGEVFGLLEETEADLGIQIEGNYGTVGGAYLRFAKTYWTFR